MLHFIDGWPLDFGDSNLGRRVADGTSVAGHRPALEDDSFALPGRRGKVPIPGPPGEQMYVVTVACMASEFEDARAMVSEIHRRLPVGGLVNLRRTHGGMDVFAPAMVLPATEIESPASGNTDLLLKLPFTLPGGVWLDTAERSAVLPAGTSTVSTLAGGSAEMEATFAIVGNGTSTMVEVEDAGSGAWWRLAGNVTAGIEAYVDPLAHTVRTSDGSDLSRLLVVGDRPFYVSADPVVIHTRNGQQQTRIIARRSWYE